MTEISPDLKTSVVTPRRRNEVHSGWYSHTLPYAGYDLWMVVSARNFFGGCAGGAVPTSGSSLVPLSDLSASTSSPPCTTIAPGHTT